MLNVEIRILMVSVISFVYESALIIFLYWGSYLLPSDIGSLMAINVLWMLDSGVFPIATVIINTSVRSKLISMLLTRKRVTKVTTFHNSGASTAGPKIIIPAGVRAIA
ncbi:hypothetical protein L596_019217 [Steinernema carpocapsae]|uniref:Uncharacterized protein n=1 Tax=Steinernema carpocapsae TaxID=34508 RepID=A0A4U5MQC9_STECR|nr:hypothetical protein L596_019217 [Steinernema carpocapsae]